MFLGGVYASTLTSASIGVMAGITPDSLLLGRDSATIVPSSFDPAQLPSAVESNLLETTLVRLCRMESGTTDTIRLSAVGEDFDYLVAGVQEAFDPGVEKDNMFLVSTVTAITALLGYYSVQTVAAGQRQSSFVKDFVAGKVRATSGLISAAGQSDSSKLRTILFTSQPWEAPEPLKTITFRL